MRWLSQHLRERYSLKPCPPDITLSWQFTVMSKVVPATPGSVSRISLPRRACLEAICFGGHWGLAWQLEQKFFLEARAIKSPFLPVRAKDSPNNLNKERLDCIIIHFQKTKEGIAGKPPTFFLAAFCLMQWWSQHLRELYSLKPCPPTCNQVTVLACACERQSDQIEQGKTCHMNCTIFFIQKPKKALLANRQHSFLQLFAWCSDWANTSGNGTVWNHVHLTLVCPGSWPWWVRWCEQLLNMQAWRSVQNGYLCQEGLA